MPLFHLIALIINAHPLGADCRTFAFNLDIVKKNQKDQLVSRSIRRRAVKQRLDVDRLWLITTNNLRIDLLFTMSDNQRSSGHDDRG
jgi:hypothetical protein